MVINSGNGRILPCGRPYCSGGGGGGGGKGVDINSTFYVNVS